MVNNIEHLSMCLWAICISSLKMICLFYYWAVRAHFIFRTQVPVPYQVHDGQVISLILWVCLLALVSKPLFIFGCAESSLLHLGFL